ncbi:MAG: hypothetical protein IKC03_04300 [Oscillospiraceae bacterium]|nr:hypothetical protein [Oscillospiraceae bacterium]
MKKVIIGRKTKTGIEYLRDKEESIHYFDSMMVAREYLLESGTPEEELNQMVFRESIGICFRCGAPLFLSDLPEYTSQCFACDEDFYSFEQEIVDLDRDLYQCYQLEWMITHDHSISELLHELTMLQEDCPDATVTELFEYWEQDVGFGSEIWACRAEWEVTEKKIWKLDGNIKRRMLDDPLCLVDPKNSLRTADELYNKYQLCCMIENNCSLQMLVQSLADFQRNHRDLLIDQLFALWMAAIISSGFTGRIGIPFTNSFILSMQQNVGSNH